MGIYGVEQFEVDHAIGISLEDDAASIAALSDAMRHSGRHYMNRAIIEKCVEV